MGPRGDVIIEADWCVGEFIAFLEKENLLENTLIIFTSDNGPVVNDGYHDDSIEKLGNHTPSGELRDGKYSLFEAGTRVPFITYWKGKIQPKVSDALVCQLDIFSSLAELTGSDTRTNDSEQILEVFMGKSENARDELVLEATSRTALRKGKWIMIPPYKGPALNKAVNIETGNSKKYQLYNLSNDIAQQQNLADTNKDKLEEMIAAFKEIRGDNSKTQKMKLK
jgi:arylsulfatase A-like enzyme